MLALFCQAANVSYHGFDFIRLQTLAVSRHLAFALLNRTGEFVVAHLCDFGVGETSRLRALARRRIALAAFRPAGVRVNAALYSLASSHVFCSARTKMGFVLTSLC